MRFLLLTVSIFFSIVNLYANDKMAQLLNEYQEESKLSKITKHESAGFLELYTRDELERMQAHTLLDVFKTLPGLILTKDSIGTNTFRSPKMPEIFSTAARLYVNDHEMTSASFGSAFLIWGDMPIEYIDHIEVYKATSSIEFGNEVASLIIRVYTKKAKREEGGKLRILLSDSGGYDTNIYHAQALENGLSYFVYANKDNIKNDTYYNYYNTKEYEIKNGKESYTLFANLQYKNWILDLGVYSKSVDSFTGPGYRKTPTNDKIISTHAYAHLSKIFENDIKMQISYDNMSSNARFKDENYILISDPDSPGSIIIPPKIWAVKNYHVKLNDQIASVILEKKFHWKSNNLLIGCFYKYKQFKDSGQLQGDINYRAPFNNYYKDLAIENSLDLTSLYFENSYDYDETLKFILSMKGDFYRYKKSIKSQNKLIARVGVIKNIDKFQFRVFASHSYMPASFIQLYNDYNTPVKVDNNLEYPTVNIYNAAFRYKNSNSEFEFFINHKTIVDGIRLKLKEGYINSQDTIQTSMLGFKYRYSFDRDNRIYVYYSAGRNNHDIDQSPSYSYAVRLFNRYKKFDIYNEFTMRDSYEHAGVEVGNSYDYTVAVKYSISNDISFGVRADNVFNTGYEQAYPDYSETIPVSEQRVWLNLEVLF